MAELNWSLGLTPDFSSAIKYQEAGQANRQRQADQQQEQAKQAALSAYAQNPQTGLAGVIATDPRTGIALQDQQLQADKARRDEQAATETKSYQAKISLAKALVHVPRGEQRAQTFSSLAPLIPGVRPEDIQALQAHVDDDSFLNGLAGEYTKKLEFMNLGEGVGIAADPQTGQVVQRYEAPRRYSLTPGTNLVEVGGQGQQPSQGAPLSLDQVQSTLESAVPGARITSGLRTPEHNAAVGGVANSHHLTGTALDIVPPAGMSMAELKRAVQSSGLPTAELINEGDHVHVAWAGPRQAEAGGSRVVAQGAAKPALTPYEQAQLARQDRNDARAQQNADRQTVGSVNKIRNTFNALPFVKDFNTVATAYDTIQRFAGKKDPTAPDDISMIYSYMRMNDPGSVVREGEFATAQNAAGIPDRVRNLYNKALSGNRLNPNQRQQFLSSAQTLYDSRRPEYDRLVQEYQGYTKAQGGTERDIQARPGPVSKRGPGVSFQPNDQQKRALTGLNGSGPAGAVSNPVILNPNDPSSSFGNLKSGQYFIGPDGQVRKKP